MEFIARTVTHPDTRINKSEAEKSLIAHPEFKKGSVIVDLSKTSGQWVAVIHEPKLAADPPPFIEEADDSAPSDDVKPPKEDSPSDEGEDESSDDGEKKEKPKGEKVEIGEVLDLVKAIAQAVGVPVPSDIDPSAGPEGDLGGPPHPGGPDLPGGPPPGPEGGPPHDETSSFPGGAGGPGGGDTKQIIHRKAPPGAVPIGAPAFASVKQPKVASFDLEEVVPEDLTLSAAVNEIESLYGQYGYKVKDITPARNADGQRVMRARVSVR